MQTTGTVSDIAIDYKTNKPKITLLLDERGSIPNLEEIKNDKEKFVNNFTILSLTNSNKEYNIKYQMEDDVFTLNISYETIE